MQSIVKTQISSINQLHTLLSEININFDVIGVTKSRLKKGRTKATNIDIKVGSLLYIRDTLKYICRKNLKKYKPAELESTFIELLSSSSKNIIVGCIYKHPSMHSSKFNSIYLNDLLEKLSHVNKNVILIGDFNIDLLKYDTNSDCSDFLDAMYDNFLLPHIGVPSRVTSHSKTLIDNIFSNTIEDGSISGNLVTATSDHYGQFLLMKNLSNKKNIANTVVYHQNFQKINEKQFENDLQNTIWEDALEIHSDDVDKPFETFFSTMKFIIDRPLKKMSLKERKLKLKPWLTKGTLTSINNKNKSYRKYCRAKDQNRKHELHTLFKQYRNSLNNIIKVSKANHYLRYFSSNKRNLLKIWEGIKELIHTKPKTKKKYKFS